MFGFGGLFARVDFPLISGAGEPQEANYEPRMEPDASQMLAVRALLFAEFRFRRCSRFTFVHSAQVEFSEPEAAGRAANLV